MKKTINLSGWATKDFTLDELKYYLLKNSPPILEISKDFFKNNVSIKSFFFFLEKYRKENKILISYAGTTDFVSMSGLSFEDYIEYVNIQFSQALFLRADFFRILIGENKSLSNINERLIFLQNKYPSLQILVEFHNGWECDLENFKYLLKNTNINFIIDFRNLLDSNLSYQKLKKYFEEYESRISYFHSRNLNNLYIEDDKILLEEREWSNAFPDHVTLWEPKKIKYKEILNKLK